MHLIFCVDDDRGLSFCGRRLSRDREVYAHILRFSEGHLLWTAPNSAALFPEGSVTADPAFLQKASCGEYCFMETSVPKDSVDDVESVILYCWNRRYPSTEKFDESILTGLHLCQTEAFPGKSHDQITMERYTL